MVRLYVLLRIAVPLLMINSDQVEAMSGRVPKSTGAGASLGGTSEMVAQSASADPQRHARAIGDNSADQGVSQDIPVTDTPVGDLEFGVGADAGKSTSGDVGGSASRDQQFDVAGNRVGGTDGEEGGKLETNIGGDGAKADGTFIPEGGIDVGAKDVGGVGIIGAEDIKGGVSNTGGNLEAGVERDEKVDAGGIVKTDLQVSTESGAEFSL